jgi:hypothetical protein
MVLKLRRGVVTADVEYGTALLDEDRGIYWNLNPTGAVILRTLLDGGTVEQTVQALTDEYEVDHDSARRDVEELVHNLQSAKLVEQQEPQ